MAKRYIGGIISATKPTININYASGIYNLTSQLGYIMDGIWPSKIPFPPTVEYLVVGGGGGGAPPNSGNIGNGGGGAGGFLSNTNYTITASTSIIVTVGAGAPIVAPSLGAISSNGSDSMFGSITSIGGGSGRAYGTSNPSANGGSGGGGTYDTTAPGSGTAGQGYTGGLGYAGGAGYGGGGGGGAGGVGGNGGASGGTGGIHKTSSISGTSTNYAGGGGGGVASGGTGGTSTGGGGAGGLSTSGSYGTTNTGGGGGGGGGSSGTGSSGGSGIVIIRYSDIYRAGATQGSPIITVSGGYRIYKFTSSGSITF